MRLSVFGADEMDWRSRIPHRASAAAVDPPYVMAGALRETNPVINLSI
jgi:hypothetical protein